VSRLDNELGALTVMDKDALKDRWAKLTGCPAPRVSTAMLKLALGYELQARTFGGLSREARKQLERAPGSRGATTPLRPGMRLARTFGDTVHVVTVSETGEILWNGREWRSLSEVARAITGTRWSGPAFFGLKQTKAAA
jgi:hypothetical protein